MEVKENRKTKVKSFSATRQVGFSFIAVILVGAILLSMPFSNKLSPSSFLNNLFISTSATCVTGLVPIVVAEQYSFIGQIIILLLIQIGGLGFLTLLNVTILLFRKELSYTNKIVMQEALNRNSLKDISKYIKRTIKYTLIIELIGALLLAIRFIPDFGVSDGIYYAIFHSVSAFCNAGFDLFGSTSLILYQDDVLVNLVIASLIIAGGLGFVIWIDLRLALKKYKEKFRVFQFKRFISTLSLHTKVVLSMTLFLIVSGTILFFLLEMNNPNTIGELSFFDKLLVSYFQSVTTRTAGFATVDIASLNVSTKLFMSLFMFIGGSPAGTAGGIKTVTFLICWFYIRALARGKDEIVIFKRVVSDQIVKRSMTIFIVSFFISMVGLFGLSITEKANFIDIVFETFSAFGTVGLTANVTPFLSEIGKIIIIILMYIGRIGPITMVFIFTKKYSQMKGKDIVYPKEDILIG